MPQPSGQRAVEKLLKSAGIKINGKNPWDIKINNPKLYKRVLAGGSLALGESYMDGWWEVKSLDKFFYRVLKADLKDVFNGDLKIILSATRARVFNLQKVSRAFQIGEKHYDVDPSVYDAMLDENMVYTCGYWKNAKNLDQAQNNKLDLVCKKIGLKKGDKVLDIGCGWGSFARFAAKNYGAKVVGITVSKNQAQLARKRCKGLPVEIRLQDYRDVDEKFDHIVSLGMIEHVGYKNYDIYMKVARKNLKDGGLFLLHTIGNDVSVRSTDPWIGKYIFPNSMLPSIKQLAKSIEKKFVMEDWHSFGTDYDKTLMAWYNNFMKNWVKNNKNHDERFVRMWKYYLSCCAGLFRSRQTQLWQIVLSPNGVEGGYKSIR